MSELPPGWTFEVYSKLWLKFKNNKFSNEDAQKVIKNNKNLNQALSRLKRDGWLRIELNPQDARKSVYILKNPEIAIKEVIDKYAKE